MTLNLPTNQSERFARRATGKRGQAAIFDGIMFLMLVSISVALMFSFASGYGQAQSKVLRSSHLLNYVHSIGKTLYYLDVATLKDVDLDNPNKGQVPNAFGQGVSTKNLDYKCSVLERYRSNSVAELMKRDLSDGFFDNKYGNPPSDENPQGDLGNTPGRLALRCAAAELMKPITSSGFDFNVDVLSPSVQVGSGPTVTMITDNDLDDRSVSNVNDVGNLNQFMVGDSPLGCMGIASRLKGKQLIAITFPFSVFNENEDPTIRASKLQYTMRICVWPSEKT